MAKGQKYSEGGDGDGDGEDKEMTQAWRTDSFLSDVIIHLLGSRGLNDDIQRREEKPGVHEDTVTFTSSFTRPKVRAVK